MTRVLLFLLLLLSAAAVHADSIVTVPSAPAAGQAFDIVIDSYWRDGATPQPQRVFVFGRDIYVNFTLVGPTISVVSPWQATIHIPALAAGTYQLHARLLDGNVTSLFEKTVVVSGNAPGISVTPTFDRSAGNRVVHITGSFPGATPQVFFGTKAAEAVERVSATQIDAAAPNLTHVREVDVTVRGDGYTYVLPSGFTYVGDDEYESVLVPVTTRSATPGAHGSLWKSDVRIVNRSSITMQPGFDYYPTADAVPLAPRRVVTPSFVLPRADVDDPPTVLMYVRSELMPFVTFESRTRDLSRAAETWGTEIPVVRERDMTSTITLLDVPMSAGFRQSLRLYIPEYVGCCGVAVTFYSNDGDVLATRTLALTHPNGTLGGLVPPPYVREGSNQFELQPAYGQLDLQSIPELAGHETIWITASQSYKLWGFVSVTNDATQHVTTITPR